MGVGSSSGSNPEMQMDRACYYHGNVDGRDMFSNGLYSYVTDGGFAAQLTAQTVCTITGHGDAYHQGLIDGIQGKTDYNSFHESNEQSQSFEQNLEQGQYQNSEQGQVIYYENCDWS